MSNDTTLAISTNYEKRTAELRLIDANGMQLGYHLVDFQQFTHSEQLSLFDLDKYLNHFVLPEQHLKVMAEIGVCIAKRILGDEIFAILANRQMPRTLCIQLTEHSQVELPMSEANTASAKHPHAKAVMLEESTFTTALACIPWEIARETIDGITLGETNLQLRVAYEQTNTHLTTLALPEGETVRVLFIFAEAPSSPPLGLRQERRELLQLLNKEVYPKRNLIAHTLAHGVTRTRLLTQLQENAGYHIVHWSGHGARNVLELAQEDGQYDDLSGSQLLALFAQAGVALPQMVFLSTSHSGDAVGLRNWDDFFANKSTHEADASPTPHAVFSPENSIGSIARTLIMGGVPSVVAMRYAIGDEYVRELALAFYRALLVNTVPRSVAQALAQARMTLLKRTDQSHFMPCDHATPLLYGQDQSGLAGSMGRSPALRMRRRSLPPLPELEVQGNFVGRTHELALLGANWLGQDNQTPVAQIIGLGGIGKTALAAEVLDLWQDQFDWLLLLQAKPNALGLDAALHEIHVLLDSELGIYHHHQQSHPADAIYLPLGGTLQGAMRLARMQENLLRAMQDEAILLVLDSFETNTKPIAVANGQHYACQDPLWDELLAKLACGLQGTHSRLLITCRRPLAAFLANAETSTNKTALPASVSGVYTLPLAPLSAPEARLYLQQHPQLMALHYSTNQEEQLLAQRLLLASRFHPLLMDRLARLCAPGHRTQLMQALALLEGLMQGKQVAGQLPQLLVGNGAQNAAELSYLEDALVDSFAQLIKNATQGARKLLWMTALANEAIGVGLLQGAWQGESLDAEQLRQIKHLLTQLSQPTRGLPPVLPVNLQAFLQQLPEETRIAAMASQDPPPAPPMQPLLAELLDVGLLMTDNNGAITCNQMVRESILTWAQNQPELDRNAVWLAYAERLQALFVALRYQDMVHALDAGCRALVYCVQANAFENMAQFASEVVTATTESGMLQALLPHLQAAANAAPVGPQQWRCLLNLADGLHQAGQTEASLAFYQQAATLAQQATQANTNASTAWNILAAIYGNWANALCDVGQLATAKQRQLDCVAAQKQAGWPLVGIIGSELEALRIAIMQGEVFQALPQINTRLAQVSDWWQQHQAGQHVAEAPDPETLARTWIGALDIARQAAVAQEDWPMALARLDSVLAAKQALHRPYFDLAVTRFNRASVLIALERYTLAQAELEACLTLFATDHYALAKVLSALADLFAAQGDARQAILQERRALALRDGVANPRDRAISHNNLARYLQSSAEAHATPEAAQHQLAALLYQLCAGLRQDLQTSLHSYAIVFRRARASGQRAVIPCISELLADPAFAVLYAWLTSWLARGQSDVAALQAEVDGILMQIEAEVAAEASVQLVVPVQE